MLNNTTSPVSNIAILARRVTKISVVTPTLNAANYLLDCMKSVQAQKSETVEVEHLILDGGSNDGTLQLTDKFPVVMVPRPKDFTLVDAVCLGFEQASGDLVVFLGADDIFFPGAFDAVAEAYQRERRKVLFCRTRWVDDKLKSLGELAPTPFWMTAEIYATLGWCYNAASAMFIEASLYREMGGFNRSFPRSCDYEFYTRILQQKIPFSSLNIPVSMYRRHNENESLKKDPAYYRELRLIRDSFGPTNPLVRFCLSWMFRTWIYSRNPSWSYHQLSRKMKARTLRG